MSATYPKPPKMSKEQADRLIDQSYADYRRQIEDLQRKAQWDLKAVWGDEFHWPTDQDRVEEARRIIQRYGDMGAQVAQDYYMQVRTATSAAYDIDLPPYEAPRYPSRDDLIWQLSGGTNNTDVPGLHLRDVIPDADGNVHNKAGIRIDDLWPSTGNIDDYLDYISKWIQSAGRMQVQNNIRMDPTQPRWARIPKGETCEFCLMLASRGFDYLTEETASLGGSFHNGACDCAVVPSWVESKISGYNPYLLEQRWQACVDTVALLTTEKEYDKYVQAFVPDDRHPEPFSYSHWKRNLELAEARQRSKQWLNGGDPPVVTYLKSRERIEKVEPRDLFAIDILQANGFILTTLEEDAPKGYSNIDLRIGAQLWEIKSPTSTSERVVEANLRKAKKQFGKAWPTPVPETRVVFNSLGCELDDAWIANEISRQISAHGITEALQITKGGSILRIK